MFLYFFYFVFSMLVISCSNGREIGHKLAHRLKARYSELWKEVFPDGELHLRFTVGVKGREVALVQSLSPFPNDSLVELVLAIKTAKQLGAKKVIVVVPYFCYMRQDKRFKQGEVVSNKIVSQMVQHAGADAVYTVAGHLHRVDSMKELFSIPAYNLQMFDEFAKWIKKKFDTNVVIVGPDIESHRVGRRVAQLVGCEYDTFLKKRVSGSRVKHTAVADVDAKGKHVVIIDDIVSTGGTISGAARHLRRMGAKSVSAICVHLMSEQAGEKLRRNGIRYIAASNTIPSKFSVLDASSAIATALKTRR